MPEEEQHFYGGQAVLEGVMMRGLDHFAVAVRRHDGQVLVASEPLRGLAVRSGWHKWPLLRGNYMLLESLSLGMRALQFSADVLTAEEAEKQAAAVLPAGARQSSGPETGPSTPADSPDQKPAALSRLWVGLTTALALALGVGLFVLLPTAVPGWLWGAQPQGPGAQSLLLNLVEGAVRLAVIVLYILVISLMKYVKRVFQYHGAEHATINCYEAGEPVTLDNCLRHGPLHPRCGTAFLLVVIVVKIIVGCFFGWPAPWLRMILRLALLPVVAGLSYEILRWAGRHRDSRLARILAGPGLLLQLLTTRRPDRDQVATAIYALAAVAPEVSLPADFAPPRRVDLRLHLVATPAPVSVGGEEESHGPA